MYTYTTLTPAHLKTILHRHSSGSDKTPSSVDLNNDSYPDLVVSPNTDRVRIYENNTDGTFTTHLVSDCGFWMSIATADIDTDGDTDVFLSNVGTRLPDSLIAHDLTDTQSLQKTWLLLENQGNFSFIDNTTARGIDRPILAWGAAFGDFNGDTRPDLIVTENYIALPAIMQLYKTPGRLLMQGADGTFTATERASGVSNRMFGYTPLPTDINDDGHLDLIIGNQNQPLRVFLNDSH